MKTFKIFLSILIAITLISSTSEAQNRTKRLVLQNTPSGAFNYGFITTATTANGSALNADTIVIANNEAGVLRVTAVGYNVDSAATVTGVKIVRYNKAAGTLTLGTPTNDLAVVSDTKLGSSTFAVAVVNNNAVVQVTGTSGVTIHWKIIVQRLYLTE